MNKQKIIAISIAIFTVTFVAILLLMRTNQVSISAEYVAIRTLKSSESPINQVILKNDEVTVLKTEDEWVNVYAHNLEGWVLSDELKSDTINSTQHAISVKTFKANVPVFKDLRQTDKELGKLDTNTPYLKYAEKGNLSQIVYNNTVGWVDSSVLVNAN